MGDLLGKAVGDPVFGLEGRAVTGFNVGAIENGERVEGRRLGKEDGVFVTV